MSKKTLALLLVIIPIVLLTAGCDPICTTAEYATFDVVLDGPADGEIVSSLTPTFSWHHNESCTPDKFCATFFMEDTNYYNFSLYTSGLNSFLSPVSALQPGREYTWHAYSYRTSGHLYGKSSEFRVFFTGPICSENPLLAPVLDLPTDKSWISPSSSYKFQWYYPGNCLPTSYAYEFSSDPNFTNILKSGVTSNHNMHLEETFPNCSSVFWRIAARVGSEVGPFSDIQEFTWGTYSNCSAEIRGMVYQDQCPQTSFYVPLGNQFVLDPKCKITGGIGIHADGIWDIETEPTVLIDVRVDLGAGPCPSTGLDYKNTPNGWYEFIVLTPGEYCVSITNQQSSSSYNIGDLSNGIWTEPLTSQDVTGVTITLEDGYHKIKQNFGWDKIEQIFVIYELEKNTNCRAGHRMDYHVEAIALAGDLVPLIGQVAESDWKLAVVGEKYCYLYLPGIYDLPQVDPPPEPTPTPKASKPGGGDSYAKHTNREDCSAASCLWNETNKICKTP